MKQIKVQITREEDGHPVDWWQKMITQDEQESFLEAFVKWNKSKGETVVRHPSGFYMGADGYSLWFKDAYGETNILEEIEQFL